MISSLKRFSWANLVLLGATFPSLISSPGVHAVEAGTGKTSIVTKSYLGIEANDSSWLWSSDSISADGARVVFSSYASNLIQRDLNRHEDVFMAEPDSGAMRRMSLGASDAEANGDSFYPSISSNGRFVVFSSYATNLVAGDTNNQVDVFLSDLDDGTIDRVSIATDGSQSNGWSKEPHVSDDGRYVIFTSSASNLVAEDTNGFWDVFLRDRSMGITTRISVGDLGQQGNSYSGNPDMSADGRYLVFSSWSSNLLPNDVHSALDVFVKDQSTGQLFIASVSSSGAQGESLSFEPSISADGHYLVFSSYAWNLVPGDNNRAGDVFIRDLQTGTTQLASKTSQDGQDALGAERPAVSFDGRFVAFVTNGNYSGSDILDTDVYLRDLVAGTTTRLSVSPIGTPGYGNYGYDIFDFVGLSSDGKRAVFSTAAMLVGPSTRFQRNIYIYDRVCVTDGC